MIRIVGVQRSDHTGQEFVLLQNQGSMRVNLKGHALVAEAALVGGTDSHAVHLFSDDVNISAGQFVLLRTGHGESHWTCTAEGQRVYYTYMARLAPVWINVPGSLHLLAPQHSYSERTLEAILV